MNYAMEHALLNFSSLRFSRANGSIILSRIKLGRILFHGLAVRKEQLQHQLGKILFHEKWLCIKSNCRTNLGECCPCIKSKFGANLGECYSMVL
jgi:hypothetical protein